MKTEDMIRYFTTGIIAVILALVVFNAFQDEHSMHEHHDFFDEVRAFMSQGGRNTEQQGYDLCKRTNALEQNAEKQTSDCELIYPSARHYDYAK